MANIKWNNGLETITPTKKIIPLFGDSNPYNPVVYAVGLDTIIEQTIKRGYIPLQILEQGYEENSVGEFIILTKTVNTDGSCTERVTFRKEVTDAIVEFSNGNISDTFTTRLKTVIF